MLRAAARRHAHDVVLLIKGCPFPHECNALKTSPSTKKLTWTGRTEQEAVDKCVHHLVHSALHKKPKRVAIEAAWDAGVQSYEDDTDEEGHEEVAEGAPATPPRPPKRARMAIADDDGDHADAGDPLVEELATRVERFFAVST